ncbi:hypothetical protein GC194_07300 [bacterium]|nr:hypothetical protein [bacterium]
MLNQDKAEDKYKLSTRIKINYGIAFIVMLLCQSYTVYGQTEQIKPSFDSVAYDTINRRVFKGLESASVKIDYYRTIGYSYGDRYWYEIIIIDSLMLLNFQSPDNVDWDYIKYQKQVVLEDSVVKRVLLALKKAQIAQKKPGIPLPPAAGYTGDRLYIESEQLNLAGGTVYINLNGEETDAEYLQRVKMEMALSSSISGNYIKVFNMLESLFADLPFLLESKNKQH